MQTTQNPGMIPRDFRTALDIDMATKGINERELGKLLGLSQQSISKWRHRGFPPLYRVDDLKAIFGPDSQIGRIDFAQFAREVPKLRVQAPSSVPDAFTPKEPIRVNSGSRLEEAQAELRAWRSEQELAFLRSLPPALLGGLKSQREFDYTSSKLALEVVHAPRGYVVMHERLADKALRMLAAEARSQGDRRKLLLVVLMGNLPMPPELSMNRERWARALPRLMDDMEAVGIELLVLRSGAEIAQAVCELEGVPFEPIAPRQTEEFEE